MTTLTEHQYELSAVDSNGLVFGTEDTGYLTLPRPSIASADQSNGDTSRPMEDGLMFGRDFRGGKSIGFEMGVLTDVANKGLVAVPPSPSAAYQMNLDYLDALENWWTDPAWRATPRSIAMLRTCEAGRTSRCYGRPRRYDEAVSALTRQGYSTVVCDFQMMDNLWYADAESSVTTTILPPPDGGFIFPLEFPLTTTLESSTEVVMVVGGTKATWVWVEFEGPVLNPSVTIGPLTVGLYGQVADEEVVTVDPRPWARTVLRESDGASLAGLMSSETPAMRDMLVKPGTYVVKFSGIDPTGTARVTLRWRNARSRP